MLNEFHECRRTLSRLLRLIWGLGPRDMAQVGVFLLVEGLTPLLNLVVLQRMVDSAAAMITGGGTLEPTVFWLAAWLLLNGFQAIFGFWLSMVENIQERLKARAQEQLLLKAGRLALASFERPETFDQLHRAQRALDTRFWGLVFRVLALPAYIIMAVSLLLYVGSASLFFPIVILIGLVPVSIGQALDYRRVFHVERKQSEPTRMLNYLGTLMTERGPAVAETGDCAGLPARRSCAGSG